MSRRGTRRSRALWRRRAWSRRCARLWRRADAGLLLLVSESFLVLFLTPLLGLARSLFAALAGGPGLLIRGHLRFRLIRSRSLVNLVQQRLLLARQQRYVQL